MRILAVLFLLLVSPCAHPQQVASAQTLTPQDARATLTVARAQATAASDLATTNAPTATTPATSTPMPPTSTPVPTATATNAPTATQTPAPEPSATPQPTPVATSTPTPARKARTIYDDWPLLALLGIGALVVVIAAWRLLDGRTITLPGRGRKDDA